MLISKTDHPNNRNLKFLVIEDDQTVQKLMTFLLPTLYNCEIHLKDSGEEGILTATTYLFDLIFLDIDLPGINGIDTADIIRKQKSGRNNNTPIIALSGNLGEKQRCLDVGINAFLHKSFSAGDLKEVVDKVLY